MEKETKTDRLEKNRCVKINPSQNALHIIPHYPDTVFHTPLTCLSKCLILVPCLRSSTFSSLRSFRVKSSVFLLLWVRREAQMARYRALLSSVGFPLGLLITPTRQLELLDFCKQTPWIRDSLKKETTANQ